MVETREIGQLAVVVLGIIAVAILSVGLFVFYPDSLTDLFGLVIALVVILLGIKVISGIASSMFASYNVAEVAVEGPITRDGGGGGPLPSRPQSTPADDIVEQIDRADEDENVDALLLKLNTPGGEVVPSDDIRLAAERFDGPTVAYTNDVCASGGYWIASGCDALWARDGSIVGSIGVIGSRVNASDLAEKVGLSYERFAAGEFKDAGTPLKELEEDERAYLQGLIDDYYETFVDRVSDGRDMDPEFVRDTEARIYLGEEAHELGLVDELGTRRDLEDELTDQLETDEVVIEEFEPQRPLMARLGTGAQQVAYAFGAGIAGLGADREFRLRLRN
ncbi:signal peptide peptidase SppA [Natrialba magadii ATCC 43099]|uniref:Signal peptide peptidase SppA n=1 Tax=Natrialba magadii (strain ATCC 43099 / DSM 3394 / CCM 3739 / CIP 104546 / IAM 13178 / JCM 8861 / NBRC 102185 / NCIMB 2190 / MS3) TaxID=547559 RepID=D3SYX9_NATMM|nr:signal peptide peptidase SppA [Natrialba magadii]ADD06171.1 signal peptide peptidase SppA [Natrialba magadii ATCC 43099]ELY30830.1 signal peptide peptidase SppA, 36K type [Natrialba magadii ATCC 43099]